MRTLMRFPSPIRRSTPENGSILLLFAFLIVVIVLFVALVVDSARLASAGRQKSQSADLLAMSFLKGYLTNIAGATRQFDNAMQNQAFYDGLNTAATTGALNFLTANKVSASSIVDVQQVTSSGDLFGANFNQAGSMGEIRVGRWFFERPANINCSGNYQLDDVDTSNRCPCITTSVNQPFGCFAAGDNLQGCRNPLDPNDGTRVPCNSVRVTLNTDSAAGKGVQVLFGKLAGWNDVAIRNSGTAAVVPRHGVVLLDLSRSTTADTHYQFQKAASPGLNPGKTAAEFSYACPGGCSTIADPQGNYGECGGVGPGGGANILANPYAPAPTDFTPETAAISTDNWRTTYSSAPLGYAPVCNAQDVHCQRDYQCVKVFRQGSGAPNPSEDYLVDAGFTDVPASLGGPGVPKLPQPHTAMLAAAHSVFQVMYQNRSLGDAVGFIGFDRKVNTDLSYSQRNRYIPLSPLITSASAVSNFNAASNFQKMLDLTNPNPNFRLFRAQHDIFPRQEEFADIPLATWHAHEMLKRANGYDSAQNFVVLITSGLSSCSRAGASQANPAAAGNNPTCGRAYDRNQQSLDEFFNARVKGPAAGTLEADKILLHSIFIGPQVAPHRVVVKKVAVPPLSPGKCLTEGEMRQANLYTSLPSSGYAASNSAYARIGAGYPPTTPYLDAGFWISAASRQVGGLWMPINIDTSICSGTDPSCLADNDGTPGPDFTLTRELDLACESMGVPATPPPYPSPQFPADTRTVNVPRATLIAQGIPATGVDADGRIFCDFNCSERFISTSVAQVTSSQVSNALNEIYQTPTISLVEAPAP